LTSAGGDFASISGNREASVRSSSAASSASPSVAAGCGGPRGSHPGLRLHSVARTSWLPRSTPRTVRSLWAKFFGGTGDEVCTAVTSSDDGSSVYITGTYSNDALTLGYRRSSGRSSATRLASSWRRMSRRRRLRLLASSFGTTGRQLPTSLVADASGNVILGGGFPDLRHLRLHDDHLGRQHRRLRGQVRREPGSAVGEDW
jgi:hypothetical protein